jgi:hypothetical protein
MNRPKKIDDAEFKGWLYYQNTESGFWIYYSPDNLQAAMVDPATHEVLFIMDRPSQEALYRHPEIKKFAKIAAITRIMGKFSPRKL